jgi:AcrR family transcriptional regulator
MGENRIMASSRRPGPGTTDPETGAPWGLRERKKMRTRMAIQREAMRLFEARGYEATTIEQIAEAVEISPSTFFNYFPSKEDVVFSDPYDPLFISRFLARPKDESAGVAARRAMNEGLGEVFERDRDVILARSRLILSVPALRARVWEDLMRSRDLFCAVIAERTGRDPDDFELRVGVMMVIGAVVEASVEWVRGDGRGDLLELVNRALDVTETGGLDSITTVERSR